MKTMKSVPVAGLLGKLSFDRAHSLHSHEIEVIDIIRRFGDNVQHIKPVHIPGVKTPDIKWRKEYWEIKTISGSSRENVEHALSAAKKQSQNIIIYVPKTKRHPRTICREVSRYFYGSKSIRKIIVIIGKNYCRFP
jgi:hypothetical protein